MTAPVIADLDRWVQVLEPTAERGRRCRLSALEAVPRLVILGEPGIGKTTALGRLARLARTDVVPVRRLLVDPERYAAPAVFVDGLDQARSRDRADEQVVALARAVRAQTSVQWRLTCRAEDWRGRADLEALAAYESDEPVTTVRLLPLDDEEACVILRALGHAEPEMFLQQAQARGIDGFTETPLMLRYLHGVVAATGQWPETRFELFEKATRHLASEQNEASELDLRTDVPTLLDAAGRVSLTLLCVGAESVWRSNRSPPNGEEGRLISLDECRVLPSVGADLLGCALFRGEGHEFAPAHRTIAEFLAARTLASAVVGDGSTGRAAYPLGRALSLIAEASGRAPSELRGVYAWFAAHLPRLGRHEQGRRLLERDPVSVLLYGDVASFDTDTRRALLYSLPEADPFFRAAARGTTAVASLAGEDLSEDLRQVLVGAPRVDHLRPTVLDALASGVPVPSLSAVLEGLVHDGSQPEEHRELALLALLNIAADRSLQVSRLFDSLSALPTSHAREGLRAMLLAEPSATSMDAEAVADVLIAYDSLGFDDRVLRLYRLERRLRETPAPAVLDALAERLFAHCRDRDDTFGEGDLLADLFVAALDFDPELEAERLVRWAALVPGATEYPAVTSAVRRWLAHGRDRELALFEAIVAQPYPERRRVASVYEALAGKPVSNAIVEHLVRTSQASDCGEESLTRLSAATDIVRVYDDRLKTAFWLVHDCLKGDQRYAELFARLTLMPLDSFRMKMAARRKAKRRRESITARWTLRRLSRKLRQIRQGGCSEPSLHAAELYLAFKHDEGMDNAIDAVRKVYPGEITDAIVDRWCALARDGDPELTPKELGGPYGTSRYFNNELCIVAGLCVLLDRNEIGAPKSISPATLLCVLTQGYRIRDEAIRTRLERFAVSGLCPAEEGRRALELFWDAAFDAGASSLIGTGALERNEDLLHSLTDSLAERLTRQPGLPRQALREAISLLAKADGIERLPDLAEAALSCADVLPNESHACWLALGIGLKLARFRAYLSDTADLEILTDALTGGAISGSSGPLVPFERSSRSERYALALRYLGPRVQPGERHKGGIVTDSVRRQEVTERAIGVLAADPSPENARRTMSLLELPEIAAWHPHLRHALAAQAALRRDDAFRRPTAAMIGKALAGGPPVNASDLRAIVLEELDEMRRALHTDDTTPWKQFWNTKPKEGATEPRGEEDCRDRVLERLRDRLRPYGIEIAVPEAERGEGTRTDVLVLAGAGSNLPIEVKRHYHEDLWKSAHAQLQEYANAPRADGLGIYLVLWFGSDWKPTPARPDRQARPETASGLETMLRADLPETLRHTTDIVVFDVSRPSAPERTKRRRRR